MDAKRLQHYYLDLLGDFGFRPEIDGDGDILFKYEGGNYYIFQSEDEGYFQIIYPNFWSIESVDELTRAYRASSKATSATKVAKVYVTSNETNVWASSEIFVGDLEAIRPVLMRSLSCIKTAVDVFRREM